MDLGKLFVGGISWDTNEDRLREYFQGFGEVLEAVIMKDRNTGRARGFGFVVFADPMVADVVVREKHMIDGRYVEAKRAVPRDDHNVLIRTSGSIQGSPGPAQSKKIFVGGLASTVTESDFKQHFDQFGTITDVVVMYDHNTQRPRGFGFITFDSEEAVDRVLMKTFHELNGKMVEVKRAVPREVSAGPNRNLLYGPNYSPSRVSSLLNAYTQGYSPSPVGGYGMRVDGRFSPVTVGRSGYAPFGPGYGMGINFDPVSSPTYGGNRNLTSNVGYGRVPNTFYNGSPNRFNNSIGENGGNGFVSGLTGRNTWGNGNLNPSSISNEFMGTRNPNSGFVGPLGNIGAIWGSSNISDQGGGVESSYGSSHLNYGNAERSSFGLGIGAIGRNGGISAAPMSSYATSQDGHGGSSGNFYAGTAFYGNASRRSSSPALEGSSGSFGYGMEDVVTRNPAGYIGDYVVTNRANRGIAC